MFLVPRNCDVRVKLIFMCLKKHDHKHLFETLFWIKILLLGPVMGKVMLTNEPDFTLKSNIWLLKPFLEKLAKNLKA